MMTDQDGLPTPRRYLAIAGVSLGITLAVIDSAIANVALPTIAADLNAEPAHSIWVVNGYQLAITVSLLPLSSLGDRIGYRNIYIPGLVIFTLASLACAMATSLPMLTLARAASGTASASIRTSWRWKPCATPWNPCAWMAPSSSAKESAMKRPCSSSAKKWAWAQAIRPWTSQWIHWRYLPLRHWRRQRDCRARGIG